MSTRRPSAKSAALPPAGPKWWLNFLMAATLVCVLALIVVESRPLWSPAARSQSSPTATANQDPPKLNPMTPPGSAPTDMVWVPGGEFWMGGDRPPPDGPPDEWPR